MEKEEFYPYRLQSSSKVKLQGGQSTHALKYSNTIGDNLFQGNTSTSNNNNNNNNSSNSVSQNVMNQSSRNFKGLVDQEFLDELAGRDNDEVEYGGVGVGDNYDQESDSADDRDDSSKVEDFNNKELIDYEEEYKKRLFLKTYTRVYKRVDFYMEHINIAFSIVSIALFIVLSYLPSIPKSINLLLFAISIFLLVDFFRTFVFAKNKLTFFKKRNTILDIITLLPILVTLLPNEFVPITPLGFLRVLRILKAPRLFKLHGVTTLVNKIASLILSIIILIVLFASLITEIEKVSFHDSLYFAVVTLSTVGYGDITPKTVLGRWVVITMITTALLYLPLQINQLLSTLSINKPWHGAYKPNKKKNFVMIVGQIYQAPLNVFLNELYFNSRIKQLPAIILSNNDPPDYWSDLAAKYKGTATAIRYLKGTPGLAQDIERSSLERSKSIFIFSKKNKSDSLSDDNENILRILAIRSFSSSIPIFAQVMDPRNKFKMLSAGATQVLSIQELKMNLLAQSVLSPGFLTLVINLLRSDLRHYSDLDEYGYGNSYEIFTQPFSPSFYGLTFGEVVRMVYNAYGMILFGIEIWVNDQKIVKINPKHSLEIQEGFYGILMAKNKSSSKKIKFATLDFVQMYQESMKLSVQIHNEYGLSDKECKLAWEYDTEINQYQSKLKFIHKVDPSEKRKSLKKLLLEKKKVILNQQTITAQDISSPYDTKTQPTQNNSYNPNNNNNNNILNNNNNFTDMLKNIGQQQQQQQQITKIQSNPLLQPLPDVSEQQKDQQPIDQQQPNLLKQSVEIPIPVPPPLPLENASYQGYGVKKWKKKKEFTREIEEALVYSVETIDSINNHIILAGNNLKCIDNFIGPLRAPYIKHFDPIVILTENFKVSEWIYIDKYQDVYIIEGIPYDLGDLKRAGIMKCLKVVILSNNEPNSDSIFNDRESLLASISVKSAMKFNSQIFPIYEINNPINLKFLPGNSNWKQNDPLHYASSFAAGNVFSMSLFDSLLCQCFFNRNLLTLIKLLVGDQSNKKNLIKTFQVPLPDHFIHHRFGYLFETLVRSNIICIGMLRSRKANLNNLTPVGSPSIIDGAMNDGIEMNPITSSLDSDGSYVLTNPLSNTILRESDKLFILIRVSNNLDE
ncbi:calcium-activated BK potassium channel [Tieghemostelium lacteum]|uniref:Calcium-activated BK potassium channel n=1 Tax=Tieghemostelium lacteum TaxID=361077 RepID=A0A151Z2J9_TIELA|nr:calcium-activated BK potassium channel [Tieghemostelium lacteum]|eukprot:KYQ88167.1 calcium-activated BK potassium channel [Tieghemostelium lacteum]